jgi:hypothetical protein
MRWLVLRTTAQTSFDQSDASVVPSQHLFRAQAIIEPLLGSEKSGGHQNFLQFDPTYDNR